MHRKVLDGNSIEKEESTRIKKTGSYTKTEKNVAKAEHANRGRNKHPLGKKSRKGTAGDSATPDSDAYAHGNDDARKTVHAPAEEVATAGTEERKPHTAESVAEKRVSTPDVRRKARSGNGRSTATKSESTEVVFRTQVPQVQSHNPDDGRVAVRRREQREVTRQRTTEESREKTRTRSKEEMQEEGVETGRRSSRNRKKETSGDAQSNTANVKNTRSNKVNEARADQEDVIDSER
ncbi:hypothetical protein Tco_1266049 [Tanacetum coccineum]